MPYIALARKYRPRRFAEIATQQHVSETLRRAIAEDRVSHAYLFAGPRGIGKTTIARVLAMALNCSRRGADGEPCGECESCQRIWSGQTGLDVVEIDAASNRGVDDARELRERAMYAPSEEGRYKVYILDEAHMLTREAWNALLKILEEPPPRVIFVFATTEPQKIQQTAAPILSRCQRFDFRRIGVADILARLREVAEAEDVVAPDEALKTIARRAEGGMRDALSLLDQVLAFTGGAITVEAVRNVLGLVEQERYLHLLEIVAERRHADVFEFVEGLLDDGYDMVEFHRGLVDVLRTLLRVRVGGGEVEDLENGVGEKLRACAASFSGGDLVRMLALATDLEADGSLRRSANPRLLVEMLLLRYTYLDRTVELEDLLAQLGGEEGQGTLPRPSAVAREAGPGGKTEGGSVQRKGRAGPGKGGQDARSARRADTRTSRGDPESQAGELEGSFSASGGTKAPSGSSAIAQEATTGALEAWQALLDRPAGLPKGILPFLRAAAFESHAPDHARLSLPPGPGLERLQAPAVRHALQAALEGRTGRAVKLEIEALREGEEQDRITEETVRNGRLRGLLEEEPKLREAVQELDLELMD